MPSPASPTPSGPALLIVASEFPPGTGGIGAYAYEIARRLARRGAGPGPDPVGWDVQVAAVQGFSDPARIAAFNAGAGVTIETLTVDRSPSTVAAMIRRRRWDVVLAADVHALRWSWLATRTRRIPLVTLGHGSEFLRSRGVAALVKRLLYRTCTHVVFNSRFTEAAAASHGYRVRRSSIIYPAGGDRVPVDRGVADALCSRLKLAGRRVMVTVGTVSRRKGQSAVIAALPEVLRQVPEAHYLVVGRESDSGEAQRLARDLGVEQAVTFAGALSDAERAAAYDLAEFSVLPSRNLPDEVEGFGIVVLEAGACGRTAIGSAATGVAEAIQDGVTGLLVPPDSPAALASAIVRLLQDAALRDALSRAAREHAATQTWEARAAQWHELLRTLVRRR